VASSTARCASAGNSNQRDEIVAALADGDAERCRSLQESHVSAAFDRLVEIEKETPSALQEKPRPQRAVAR
jgi:DNA-binding GntR family transcriptional regulator